VKNFRVNKELSCNVVNLVGNRKSHKTTVALVLKAGLLCESPNEEGISHFLEHMVAQAIPFLRNIKKNIVEPIYAYTNYIETVYMFSKESENNEDDLDFFIGCINTIRHILYDDLLDKRLFCSAKKEVLSEYENINFAKTKAIKQLFFSESHINGLPIGDIICINKISFEEIVRYRNNHYLPENAAIFVISSMETDYIENVFNKALYSCGSGKSQNLLSKIVISESTFAKSNSKINKSEYSTNYLVSKSKRRTDLLDDYIKESLCLNLALDSIKLFILSFYCEIDSIPYINSGVEVFNFDWYIIRFNIIHYNDAKPIRGIEKNKKHFKLTYITFCQAKANLIKLLETEQHEEYNHYQIVNECIQHYLYKEPIMDLEDEKKHIYRNIDKIDFCGVEKKFNEVIENMVSID
jgi:hypothetical protein